MLFLKENCCFRWWEWCEYSNAGKSVIGIGYYSSSSSSSSGSSSSSSHIWLKSAAHVRNFTRLTILLKFWLFLKMLHILLITSNLCQCKIFACNINFTRLSHLPPKFILCSIFTSYLCKLGEWYGSQNKGKQPESLVHALGVMCLSRSLYSSLGPSADSRSGPTKNVYSISKDSIILGFEDCS